MKFKLLRFLRFIRIFLCADRNIVEKKGDKRDTVGQSKQTEQNKMRVK